MFFVCLWSRAVYCTGFFMPFNIDYFCPIMKFNAPVALTEIAEIASARIIGPSNVSATGINEIHMVEAGDITFVDHPKYYDKALQSNATYIIINKEVDVPNGKSLLYADDPFTSYVSIVRHFRPFVPMDGPVASSALVGAGTVLQPGAYVGNQVVIGRDCIIHPGVVIYDHCIIGDRVTIHAGTIIGADAFYFKRRPDAFDKMLSCGRVIIEDDVEIGASCTIDKGVSGDTVIGKGTKFDNMVHIGHDTVIGRNCLFAAQVGVAGVVRVEDDVILWGQVGVQKDLVIGKGAVVLGQSGVPKSLKGGITYFGSPVREAREKMKELAMIKRLPEIIEHLGD